MSIPRFPGSRVVAHSPHLMRGLQNLSGELRKLRDRTRPETLSFTDKDPARGVPCTSATMISTHQTLVFRSGAGVYVDVACGTGTASVMQVQLYAPDIPVTGAAVLSSPAGGTEQIERVTLIFPDAWPLGESHLLHVQARRVSGSDATTMRVVRAVQR